MHRASFNSRRSKLTHVKKILFLCTHNAARSQIAEGLVNAQYGDRYKAYSAGNEPTSVHPCAVEVMDEIGIDISAQRAKSLEEFNDMSFDYVVTMCAGAAESCPIFPGGVEYLERAFPDPVSAETHQHRCEPFRHVRDEIEEWIVSTFDHP
ncbi:MAG: arsenate reductase ArsC [Halobacteriota archaeon]